MANLKIPIPDFKLEAIRNLYDLGGVNSPDEEDGLLLDKGGVFVQPTAEEKTEIDTEVARLQTEYDNQEYARKREAEYPSVQDLVVALYDTDDKSAIEAKRAEVKNKFPKT